MVLTLVGCNRTVPATMINDPHDLTAKVLGYTKIMPVYARATMYQGDESLK